MFDASPLLHSAKADRLDVLGDLVKGFAPATTRAVLDEIHRNDPQASTAVLRAEWISVVETDSLELLNAVVKWSMRMGLTGDGHNIGETTLCAYADVHGGVLIVDDLDARNVAQKHGLTVRGTVGLIADACRRQDCTVTNASVLADELKDSGMRLPFDKGGFQQWAREEKLLD
ncbi:hypothetical protein [Salinactinospora qingdaonensis]|uniref:PIN domain-containing protein n=1 Tax=Salinactinospora qingdaonensis TaxID=702744 RepID=A0ABP7FWJ0_9ACTN